MGLRKFERSELISKRSVLSKENFAPGKQCHHTEEDQRKILAKKSRRNWK